MTALLKILSKYVDRNVLSLSYKMHVLPHLDYGDVIYHNSRTDLMDLIERVQYKAALIVSGCWQGTSRTKLYDELGWESLSDRRWVRRLTLFYKILNGLAPLYLSPHIPTRNEIGMPLRNRNNNACPPIRTERYANSFFPYTIKEWKNLSEEAKSKPSVQSFKKYHNDFKIPAGNSVFAIRDKFGIKLLTKIRVNFSDLIIDSYLNFNCENPICSCGIEDETSVHFFLRCPHFTTQRSILISKISDIIGSDVSVLPDEHLYSIIVYGSNVYNNGLIITDTISYIRKSGRFAKLEAFA